MTLEAYCKNIYCHFDSIAINYKRKVFLRLTLILMVCCSYGFCMPLPPLGKLFSEFCLTLSPSYYLLVKVVLPIYLSTYFFESSTVILNSRTGPFKKMPATLLSIFCHLIILFSSSCITFCLFLPVQSFNVQKGFFNGPTPASFSFIFIFSNAHYKFNNK